MYPEICSQILCKGFSEDKTMSIIQSCNDTKDNVDLFRPQGLYLKPIAKWGKNDNLKLKILIQIVRQDKCFGSAAAAEEGGSQDFQLGSDGESEGHGTTVHISCLQSLKILSRIYQVGSLNLNLKLKFSF